jgi:hypothetical protein
LVWPQNADHACYPANYLRPADQRAREFSSGAHALDEWWLPVQPHLAVQKALLIVLAEARF